MRQLLLFGLLLSRFAFAADEAPKIDSVSVDANDRRLIYVHFDNPIPDLADVRTPEYWIVITKTADRVAKHTVVGVDTSLYNEAEAATSGREAEHSVILQLSDDISADTKLLDITLLNAKSVVHVPPGVVTLPTSGGPTQPPVKGAKNKDDSDIYFNGSYTASAGGDSVWNIDAFAGYMKALQRGRTYFGKIGPYGQLKTSKSKTADPDSFLTYLVFQRVLGGGWAGPFQAPYLNYRFTGWEFDRKGKELNYVTSPVLTLPVRLSRRLAAPVEPGITYPHMTLQFGTEVVDRWTSVLPDNSGWLVRGLLGGTFAAGIAPEKPYFDSIRFTGSYQVRLPSSPELFFDDRFAPIDPSTGKKGDTPPKLGTQPRHWVDAKVSYMFVKWAGITFEYTYGSLPPLFQKTDHSFQTGVSFTLKQTSFGRYSILKP